MRCFFLLLAILLFASAKADADLVVGSLADISGGATSTITDAGGLGIDLVSSFSGTSATQNVTFAGFGLDGINTRFGWETERLGTDLFHNNDFEYTISTAGTGSFDARIGFLKALGNPSDNLSITTDGVWSVVGTQWTASGGTNTFNPAAILNFTSSDPGGGFNPEVTGATFLTFTTGPQTVDFGDRSQQFDLNLLSASATSIPEPTGVPFEYILLLFGQYAWSIYACGTRTSSFGFCS